MNILILEDETTIRKALSFALQKDGHEISEYDNPLRAFENIDSQTPDLMIVDLTLPHLTGYEFIHHLRKQQLLRPTIILTSHPETARQFIDPASLNGVRLEIISKDLPFEEILNKINQFTNPITFT